MVKYTDNRNGDFEGGSFTVFYNITIPTYNYKTLLLNIPRWNNGLQYERYMRRYGV